MQLELDKTDARVIAEALQRLAIDLDAMDRLRHGIGLPAGDDGKAARVAGLLRQLLPVAARPEA